MIENLVLIVQSPIWILSAAHLPLTTRCHASVIVDERGSRCTNRIMRDARKVIVLFWDRVPLVNSYDGDNTFRNNVLWSPWSEASPKRNVTPGWHVCGARIFSDSMTSMAVACFNEQNALCIITLLCPSFTGRKNGFSRSRASDHLTVS